MKRRLSSLIRLERTEGYHATSFLWLLVVFVLTALSLRFIDEREERRAIEAESRILPKALAMLVGYDGEEFPGIEGSGAYLRVGCNDVLIPSQIPVVAPRLPSVLSALSSFDPSEGLHNPMFDKGITFRNMEKSGDRFVISIEGSPAFGGICDIPRLKAQIEETIRFYVTGNFEVRFNGSKKEYECLGDASGLCL